jgi:hypothetical protein
MNAITPATTNKIPARAPAAPSLRQVERSHAWLAAERRDEDLLPLVTADDASLLPAALREADALLWPADPEMIVVALAPVLTLVAPSGMSEDDREEWFAAAADALRGIPGDLLYRGLRVARASVDHPAKVVPMIISTISAAWTRRRADRASIGWLLARMNKPVQKPVQVCTPEEARAILAEVGMPSHAPASTGAGAARTEATLDDYLALGLSNDEALAAMAERKRLLSRQRVPAFAAPAQQAVAAAATAVSLETEA